MKYLVTGGAGFIGANVCVRLLRDGNDIVTIDDLSTGKAENLPKGATFIEGDIADDRIISQLAGHQFDAIIHLAGQSSGEISFENPLRDISSNTISTLRLLEFAKQTNVKKVIYASTMSVYGQNGTQEQFSEADTPQPQSFYAVGKLASENYLKIYCKQYEMSFVALRYFNVYGPGQNLDNMKQGMMSIFMKQILDDSASSIIVKGDLERFRDFSYIDDVVDVTVEALHNNSFDNQIINVGSGQKTTVADLIHHLEDASGSTKPIDVQGGTPGDQFGIYADVTKLDKAMVRHVTPMADGIKKMLVWAKNHV